MRISFHKLLLIILPALMPGVVWAACSAAPTASTSDALIRFKTPAAYAQVVGIVSPDVGDLVYDTTNGVLKLCDGASWNTVGSGGASSSFSAGSVGSPGFYVTGDTNTGFYQGTADTLSITSGGTEVARFNTTASAVNYFTFSPSIDTAGTGSTVTLSAAGTSTTIPITIDAKGTSSITLSDATTVSGTATANSFIPSSSTAPTNGLYLPAANTLGLAVSSGGEVQLTATALSPVASDGNALGTTTLMWADLFLASGAVINFNNGDVTLTHATDTLTMGGGNAVITGVATTGDALGVSGSSITTGSVANLTSTSTAGGASGSSYTLKLARSGANANTAHTAYGLYSTVTNTNATSGTNIAGYLSASGATTANYGLIVAAGSVGIGTTAPAATLDVNGPIYSRAYNAGSSTTINWSQGNVQYTTASCGAFTFSNMQDGGMYQLFVKGTTTGTCSFSHTGLSFALPNNHGASPTGTMTVYSFTRAGSIVFVAWIPGY